MTMFDIPCYNTISLVPCGPNIADRSLPNGLASVLNCSIVQRYRLRRVTCNVGDSRDVHPVPRSAGTCRVLEAKKGFPGRGRQLCNNNF